MAQKKPAWYEYVKELFLDLRHTHRLSLHMNSIFLVRRVIFVTVALYLLGSPALQVLIFVLSSMVQTIVLIGKWPYESTLSNLLEAFNELVVLAIGFHVLVLTHTGLPVAVRETTGSSMLVHIGILIAVNGLIWLIQLLVQAYYWCRRAFIKRRIEQQKRKADACYRGHQ